MFYYKKVAAAIGGFTLMMIIKERNGELEEVQHMIGFMLIFFAADLIGMRA